MAKRVFDTAVSALALSMLAPTLVGLGMWIRIDSRGPALFRQTRVGRSQKRFGMLKFRTMIDRPPDEVDQRHEEVLTTGTDSRITRAGRFLRRTSLDELPQLVNVLLGDMSLVGPRPILPEQLEAVPPQYMARFDVLPGVTGLAQVRGRRSLGWMQQLAYDTEYAREHTFSGDLGILIDTLGVVLRADDVYGDPSKNWRAHLRQVQDESR